MHWRWRSRPRSTHRSRRCASACSGCSALATMPRRGIVEWVVPAYAHEQVDNAGEVLARRSHTLDELEEALHVFNNWRASHSFPLNTIQVGLRDKARRAYSSALIAQRLKRV